MAFTSEDHKVMAYVNVLILSIYIITIYSCTTYPTVTVLFERIIDQNSLDFDSKMRILHNHSATAKNATAPPAATKNISFYPVVVDLQDFMLFAGLLLAGYSSMSYVW